MCREHFYFYPVICDQNVGLFPDFYYQEQCCNEHTQRNVFSEESFWNLGEYINYINEIIGRTLHDIESRCIFIFNDLKSLSNKWKQRLNKWDCFPFKLGSFCSVKETIRRIKRHPKDWEKLLSQHSSDKGLITKLYKTWVE